MNKLGIEYYNKRKTGELLPLHNELALELILMVKGKKEYERNLAECKTNISVEKSCERIGIAEVEKFRNEY